MTDQNTEIIQVNDLCVTVIRSVRRKTLSLEVGHEGVKARAPQRMRIGTIKKFINSKQQWIERHLYSLPPKAEKVIFRDGIELKLLDQKHLLKLIPNTRGKIYIQQSATEDTHKHAQIMLPVIQSQRPLEATAKDKLIRWYKQQAHGYVQSQVALFANEMNINLPKTLKIKARDYKRRWGSCDHKGDLSFNWRIIMAPAEVVDYVVIHELAHLQEFNHSRRFWNIVEQQDTNWQQHQDWLNKNGSELYII